jgi:DNA helicase-2/ATP-dependent DNA helicase PcrA
LDPSGTTTVLEVLQFVKQSKLFEIDNRFDPYIAVATGSTGDAVPADGDDEEDGKWKANALREFLGAPAAELWGYRRYISDETLFSTQHGTKGDEFERVLLVLDDEESNYNLYSYEKLFGLKPLSDKDLENQESGKETVVERTRRLFYVCCSRSFKDLAIILFTADVVKAVVALKDLKLFEDSCIKTAEDLFPSQSPLVCDSSQA